MSDNPFTDTFRMIGKEVGNPSVYEMYKVGDIDFISPELVERIVHKVYEVKFEYDNDGNLTAYFKLRNHFGDTLSPSAIIEVDFQNFFSKSASYLQLPEDIKTSLIEYKSIIDFSETTVLIDFYKMFLKERSNFTDNSEDEEDEDD